MASSLTKKSSLKSALSSKIYDGGESSQDQALPRFSQSLESLRPPKKVPRKVQFKNEVVALCFDRDFWKYQCLTEPLCENKIRSRSMENLKAIYKEKRQSLQEKLIKRY